MSLIEKLRKARERQVEIGGFTFTVRRPTDLQAMGLRAANTIAELIPFVVGWQGVKEIDVLPGGDPHPLAFDAEVCAEWLADRPDLLHPLIEAIMDSYSAHAAALEAVAKN
jgi:hypothetical protein